ncbi:unnamed protein product [Dibothriocephalus latus]|uniref:SH3 domain-containing protein n=1 Tax=Dibothriocephalus latus TaxID=60516 RepID=A0A3P7R593_DIBLA|nr:unnamed protein product [Dibothriocephalus latus]
MWKVFCHNTGRIGYVPSNNLHICPTEDNSVCGSPRTPKTHSQSGTLSRMRLRLSRREKKGSCLTEDPIRRIDQGKNQQPLCLGASSTVITGDVPHSGVGAETLTDP